jgi:hypothetical protein
MKLSLSWWLKDSVTADMKAILLSHELVGTWTPASSLQRWLQQGLN